MSKTTVEDIEKVFNKYIAELEEEYKNSEIPKATKESAIANVQQLITFFTIVDMTRKDVQLSERMKTKTLVKVAKALNESEK